METSMRVPAFVFPIAALVLTACGKAGANFNGPAASDGGSSSAAASAPSEAQKKAILASLPVGYQNADLDNGQAKFALCQSCHTVGKGEAPMVGPNLWGVFGRKSGSAPGFTYSDGIKALGVTWDAPTIDKWISNPRGMDPTTKMTYLGMENPKDRIDVVAYLKTVTSAPGG
jgi:cytochrome c